MKGVNLENGLVGYWNFEDGEGSTIRDKSGNGNNVVLYNSDSDEWATGKHGGAIHLDGSNDWGLINGDVGISGAMSIAFWFYTPNKDANDYFFDNRSPGSWWFIKNFSDGKCARYSGNICFDNRLIAIDSDWDINEWTHIVVTDDTSTAKMYINGELIDTGSGKSTTISTNLRIGTRYTNYGYNNMKIDELRLYDQAVNHEEIKAMYGQTAFTRQSSQDQ